MWTLSGIMSSKSVTEESQKEDDPEILNLKDTMGKSMQGASLRPGCLCNEPRPPLVKGCSSWRRKLEYGQEVNARVHISG